MASGRIRGDVRNQYIQDLQEKWILEQKPLRRHQKWRIFQGRVSELQFAEWLEKQSYTITGLEALREGPDIESVSDNELGRAFEVKFIGPEDAYFEISISSNGEEPPGDAMSPFVAINYLIFRVYEAAKQLEKYDTNRTAVVVVDHDTWWTFELGLPEILPHWGHLSFLPTNGETEWETFVAKQSKKYPGFPGDLAETIRAMNSIWILEQCSRFLFSCKYDIDPKLA